MLYMDLRSNQLNIEQLYFYKLKLTKKIKNPYKMYCSLSVNALNCEILLSVSERFDNLFFNMKLNKQNL